jgi:hypothetical protein
VGEMPSPYDGSQFGVRSIEFGVLKGFYSELRTHDSELARFSMAEAVQEVRVTSPESRATSFEPEVLAFCCEH